MSSKQIFVVIGNEFIYGGHFLSLGAISVVFTSAILLDILISWDFLIVVYLVTYIVYLYNRFREYEKDFLTNYNRTKHLVKYIKYMPFIICCLVLIVIWILVCFGSRLGLISGLLLLLFGLLYSMYFKEVTKKIVGFKNFYVSLVWASLVPFLAIYHFYPLNISVILVSFFVLLRLIISVSFFDIKDIESDKKEKLLTLAVFWGKKKMVSVLNLVNVLSVIFIILGVYLRLFPVYSLVLIFVIPYSVYYFRKEEKKDVNRTFLYNVIVDGEFILWLFAISLSKFLIC